MCRIQESDIHVIVTGFPSGIRDFCLVRPIESGTFVPVEPLAMLGLDRTAAVIRRLAERGQESLAMNVALCRLLVPQLAYRGSGRHLAVEEYNEDDLRGMTLRGREDNLFARDLSVAQADDWQLVTGGERPEHDSLADLAWRSFTLLPQLEDEFQDAELSAFTRAMYSCLIPSGDGFEDVSQSEISTRISRCRQSGFEELNLPFPRRRLNQLFRRILAITLRWSGQLTGVVTEELIRDRSQSYDDPELGRLVSAREQDLLALRYGAPRILSDINTGYLFGCGDLFADLINDYATACALSDDRAREEAGENLADFLFLLSAFVERRRTLRAHQRRELRQRRRRRLPKGAERRQAEHERDDTALRPSEEPVIREDVEMFRQLLPLLHERDQRRLQAYIDADGNRRAAAEALGTSLTKYSRQLRQTVFPNARRAARRNAQFGNVQSDED